MYQTRIAKLGKLGGHIRKNWWWFRSSDVSFSFFLAAQEGFLEHQHDQQWREVQGLYTESHLLIQPIFWKMRGTIFWIFVLIQKEAPWSFRFPWKYHSPLKIGRAPKENSCSNRAFSGANCEVFLGWVDLPDKLRILMFLLFVDLCSSTSEKHSPGFPSPPPRKVAQHGHPNHLEGIRPQNTWYHWITTPSMNRGAIKCGIEPSCLVSRP